MARQPLIGHGSLVTAVAFSPRGRVLASAGADDVVILWDISNPATAHELSPQLGVPSGQSGVASDRNTAQSMAFSPDGRTLALGTWDGSLVLLDTSDPTRPHLFGLPLIGHSAPITSVAFSPDGRVLASASSDHTVILWDAGDRDHLAEMSRMMAHGGPVLSVTFRPRGHTLATAGEDGTVILWDTSAIDDLRDHPEARACALAGRGLDSVEWARATDAPYERTCS